MAKRALLLVAIIALALSQKDFRRGGKYAARRMDHRCRRRLDASMGAVQSATARSLVGEFRARGTDSDGTTAGAVGSECQSPGWFTSPLPAEAMVRGSEVTLIRKRQTLEDLIRDEVDPIW
jgi:hypothetical protein